MSRLIAILRLAIRVELMAILALNLFFVASTAAMADCGQFAELADRAITARIKKQRIDHEPASLMEAEMLSTVFWYPRYSDSDMNDQTRDGFVGDWRQACERGAYN